MTFGMDGPMIAGWWVNPKTGDKFNAIDSFFEDNNLIIKTADGRILNYNQIQNYIRTDNPDSISSQNQSKPQTQENIPANILAEIDNGDDILIPDDNIYGNPTKLGPSAELGNIYRNTEPIPSQIADYDIIDRALKGKKDQLQFLGDIQWENFPQREIDMLIEVMGIPEEEIVQYFVNAVSVDDVMETIKENIRGYIEVKLHPQNPVQEKSIIEVPSNPIDIANKPMGENDEKASKVEKPKKTKKKVNG